MGMAWVNHPSSLTFSLVLSQEILILVPMYAVVLVIAVVANRADVTGLSRERQGDSLA
jgi:hypothetical protein